MGSQSAATLAPLLAPVDPWFVYLLQCADRTLYTGVTRDVNRRVGEHNSGRGARYTRGRGPVILRAVSAAMRRGDALRLEAAVKRLPPRRKARAVAGWRTLFR